MDAAALSHRGCGRLEDGSSLPQLVSTMTSHTCRLTEFQAEALRALLDARSFVFREVPYAAFSAANKDVNATFYKSGKLVVQGKGTREFIEFVLEPEILGQAKLGYEALLDPELYLPRIGVDESGKGDFFGPLCVAGVYVNEAVIKSWEDAGIRDSKAIGSDKRIRDLAKIIRKTPGCLTTVVPIGNEAYNRLYLKARSVNAVLAWGHARVIENLLSQMDRMNPPPVRAISDQFSSSKKTVEKALMPLGRDLELVQRHKAEADAAVAAASILAREEFIRRLALLGRAIETELPRGASAAVEVVGRKIFAERGEDGLGSVAKMHFRTSYRVRGLPEPPIKKWNH
jgi:ribonuclease HIII